MFWFKNKKEGEIPMPPSPPMPEPIHVPPSMEPIEFPEPMEEIPTPIMHAQNLNPVSMEVHRPKPNQPIFILKHKYQDMLEEIDQIMVGAQKSDELSLEIIEEDKGSIENFDELRLSLEDLERKLKYIDKLLFGE